MQLVISNANGYAEFKTVLGAFGGVEQLFYSVKSGSSPATVEGAQAFLRGTTVSVTLSLAGFVGAQPLETTLLSDFPFALQAATF